MNTINLKTGGLYVISAPPGSGKSTLLARSAEFLPESTIVSSDAIRKQVLGTVTDTVGKTHYFAYADLEVHLILEKIIKIRAKEGLTTIVDATNVSDIDRAPFAKIAKEFGVPFEVLILDVDIETAKERNKNRAAIVPEHKIDLFFKTFEKTSIYPFRLISDASTLKAEPNTLPHTRIDVIGDVHGLMADLIVLITKAGWTIRDGIPYHPENRILLFLGDLVDRGPQSIEVLRFVKAACGAGVALCIQGNHEAKLIKFWNMSKDASLLNWSSFANAETGLQLLKLDKREGQALIDFLIQLPKYFIWNEAPFKVAFCHADQARFHPKASPNSELMFGHSRHMPALDSDAIYQENFDNGTNEYVLFRGHIPQLSVQSAVFSLERKQAYKGQLVLLKLDDFLTQSSDDRITAFNNSIITADCEFDFDEYSKKFMLARSMDGLVREKLATKQEHVGAGLRIYKYSKSVFYDALWNKSKYLLKARGLVLDIAGTIISHPFDKVFNYHENGAGDSLQDSTKVVSVEKMNGFLGVISKHPFKNELLVTTTGSFDSDFVGYIRSLMSKMEHASILRYVSKNNVTLMFEVLHPSDPHIIEYTPEMHGLWLLGVRGKQEHDLALPEHEVDSVAKEIGLRRPKWEITTFGEVKRQLANSKTEGNMIREFSREERHVLKLKSPYYLTTKFLGRMSNSRIEHLYNSPKSFKQTLDEEFYSLVDMLIAEVPKVDLQRSSEPDRVTLVRNLVNRLVA